MKAKRMRSKDPDILASAKALRRAARKALQLGIQTSTPVYVLKDGRLVDLTCSAGKNRHPRRRVSSR